MADKEIVVGRDARVDHAGFCGELDATFNKPLRGKIKDSMLGKKLDLAEADYFQGVLISGWSSDVDKVKFLEAFEKGEISKKDFLAAIEVKKGVCKEFIAPRRLNELCHKPTRYESLRIERKKGVEIKLVDAAEGIARAIAPPV